MIQNPSAQQLSFRAWLVKQLTVSRWSAPLSLQGQALADHLGVTLSVLEEAQAHRESELARLGKAGRARGRTRYIGNDYARVAVIAPHPIRKLWHDLCASLNQEPGAVLRSLIHHFLLDPKPPASTARNWHLQGKVYRSVRGSLKIQTRITRGAQVALDTHADLWNTRPASLTRGLIIDFMEGRTERLRLVSFGTLWGDPDRYLHPEKFK